APVVADLRDAQRQLPVAPKLGLVDDDVVRAVHRSQLQLLAVLELHRRVHELLVELEMAALPVELEAGDVRSADVLVAAGQLLVDDEALELATDRRAGG